VLVYRDGIEISINRRDIVLGDMIKLKIGQMAPADLRLVYSTNIRVDISEIIGL